MADNAKIEVSGVKELREKLDRLMTSDPQMEEKIQGIVRTVLKEARNTLSRNAKDGLQMKSDPREAYKAVRSMVYRQILGGNVNILRKKMAGKMHDVPPSERRVGRGGNRRPRSQRTKDLQGYWGSDRGFILRFLNQGTQQRAIKREEVTIGAYGRRKSRWVSRPDQYGNRGSITARNWFGGASLDALKQAAADLTWRIEQLIHEQFGNV